MGRDPLFGLLKWPSVQSFFTRWWAEQSEKTKDKVKTLVDEGRLSFINGGWVQHDEAAAHYVAMIDQTTRGHRCCPDLNFGAKGIMLLMTH